jgi:hypothetical protein
VSHDSRGIASPTSTRRLDLHRIILEIAPFSKIPSQLQ